MSHLVHGVVAFVGVLLMGIGPLCGQYTWRRVYGGLDDDQVRTVHPLDGGNFLVMGTTGSFGAGASDIHLFELDAAGERQWSRTIGGPGVDRLTRSRAAADGTFWAVGYTNSQGQGGYDGLLLQLNAAGDVLLERTFGGADWDFLHDLRILANGDLLLVGETYSNGAVEGRAWLLRCTAAGDTLWTRTLTLDGLNTKGTCVTVTGDEGYVLGGSAETPAGDRNALLSRWTSDGELVWTTPYGGAADDELRDVLTCASGGYSAVGVTASYSDWTEAYHLRVDEAGGQLWYRNWGQINDQESQEHTELTDGTFVTIGYTKTSGGGGKDMFLLKSATDGDFVYGRTFGGLEDDEGLGLAVLDDGFICVGLTRSYGSGGSDAFVVRTGPEGTTATETVISSFDPLSVEDATADVLSIHPNPTTGLLHVPTAPHSRALLVTDRTGRLVQREVLLPGMDRVMLELPDGLYLLHLQGHRPVRVVIHQP